MNYSTSSGVKTSTTQISTLSSMLMGVDVIGPDTGYVTLVVYDSSNGNTTDLIVSEVLVDAGNPSLNHEFFAPTMCNKGIYCTLTYTGGGTGAKYIVRYGLSG